MSTKIELPQVKAFQTCICKLICRSLVNITLSFCVKNTKLQSIYQGLKEKHQKKPVIFTPPPPPLSLFLTVDHPPWCKFFFSHSLPLPLKSKMAAIVFVEIKKISLQENTEHSLANITPALQAKLNSMLQTRKCSLPQNTMIQSFYQIFL